MNSTAKKIPFEALAINHVEVTDKFLVAQINDGRTVSLPLSWFPKLLSASEKARLNFMISPSGYGIHWPDIDEDISIKAFVNS